MQGIQLIVCTLAQRDEQQHSQVTTDILATTASLQLKRHTDSVSAVDETAKVYFMCLLTAHFSWLQCLI